MSEQIVIDDLYKYLRALETGDPDRQLCKPEDDVLIVQFAISHIEELEAERKEIEALPDKYEKFIPDAHIGPLWGAGYASALEHVAKQIRAIIARGAE